MNRTITPPISPRVRSWGACALLLALAGCSGGATDPAIASPSILPQSVVTLVSLDADDTAAHLALIVRDPVSTAQARRLACDRLLSLLPAPDAVFEIERLLGAGDDPGVRVIVVRGIAASPAVDPSILPALVRLASDPDQVTQGLALEALSSIRTPDAARALIAAAGRAASPAISDAAYASLVRLTGRADLPQDPRAWAECISAAEQSGWSDSLIRSLAARRDQLRTELDRTAALRAEDWRRLYTLTPAPQRPAMIAQLLQDPSPALRSLGFDFINRELAAGVSVDPTVVSCVVDLLASPSPQVRADAALVLSRLAPADAGDRAVQALLVETDPRAAEALMRLLAPRPDPAARPAVLRWIASGTQARSAAFEAAFALLRAGALSDTDDRRLVLEAARAVEPDRSTTAQCKLLVALGDSSDRDRLAALLDSDSLAVARSAGEALVDAPDSLEDILAAAGRRPALFEYAVRAVVLHRPTPDGYRQIRRLGDPTPQAWHDGLIAVAQALPTSEFVQVAESEPDPLMRTDVLWLLTMLDRRPAPETPPDLVEPYARGMLLLVDSLLRLGQPTQALAALDSVPRQLIEPFEAAFMRLRTVCLVWLNRLDAEEALDPSPGPWLEALEYARTEPHADEIVARIRELFSDSLTPEQQERFDELAARVRIPNDDGPP